jgi:AcrR family transcriptional regulator
MADVADDTNQAEHWATAGYERGRRTRGKIVAIAGELFAARGYDGTSMQQIASAAATTKGAVYGHFKAKRDLYLACMEDSLSFFRDPIILDAGADAEARLHEYLLWLGGQFAQEPKARSFFVQMVREEQDDPPKIALILDLLSGSYGQLRSVITDANPDIDAGAFAFFIFSSLLLDPELHRYHLLMAGDPAPSHTLDTTVAQLTAAVIGAKT